jgi:hypothetical protein
MHRIRFAFCALALIGMAAPASAQGPIRNWLRSRRPSSEPQTVMPTASVTPTTTVGAGASGTVGTGGTTTTGPVIGTPSTVIPATTTGPVIGTRPAVTPGPTTANYAPAATGGTTVGAATTVDVPTTQYTSTSTGRRGLLGRRRNSGQGVTPTAAPMIVPAPGTSPTNIQPTPVPGNTPKPLPTTIGSTATPGATPATAAVTSATPTQEVGSSPTRTRNRLFAGRLTMRTRMRRG